MGKIPATSNLGKNSQQKRQPCPSTAQYHIQYFDNRVQNRFLFMYFKPESQTKIGIYQNNFKT
jgi:hypothetical protein